VSTPSVGYIECSERSLPDFEILTIVGAKLVRCFDSHAAIASLAVVSMVTKLASPNSPVPVVIAGSTSRLAAS
jgi:hypothetical protein